MDTIIDDLKRVSNRLIDCSNGFYVIDLKGGERITIKGKRNFTKWTKENSFVCDF